MGEVMAVLTRPFGATESGRAVCLHMLSIASGMSVSICEVGAAIQSVVVPDGRGNFVDVALGYDGAPGYLHNSACIGAILGRNVNRIAGARFELGGTTHRLAANDGPNNLHSGPHPWHERLWQVGEAPHDTPDGASVTLELVSRAGDQGFPGAADVRATYTLHDDQLLELTIEASATEATIINSTSHAYWNLNGHASGTAMAHTLQLESAAYTPVDAALIPTGEVAPVAGTPYDFRSGHALGDILQRLPQGLDTNFVLSNAECVERAATLVGNETGVRMTLSCDAPGLQVYTAGGLDARGKAGAHYGNGAGIALEAQFYPDAIHHAAFPQPIYAPGHPFLRRVTFAFDAPGR